MIAKFIQIEAAGGLVMLVAIAVALIWANSPWSGGYEGLWGTQLNLGIGSLIQLDHMTLRAWISDAGMVLFFLLLVWRSKES